MSAAVTADAPTSPGRFLLEARTGWRIGRIVGAIVDGGDGSLVLRSDPLDGRRLDEQSGTLGGQADPTGLAVDADGAIYVADRTHHRVGRYDPCCGSFVPLPCIGGLGSAPRRLRSPRGLAVTSRHHLVVVDAGNRRLQAFEIGTWALVSVVGPFDAAGRPVAPSTTSAPPPAPGCEPTGPVDPWAGVRDDTWDPVDVADAADGTLVVTDAANGLVHRISLDGRWLGATNGSGPGLPALVRPTAVAVDRCHRVHVLDEATGRLRVLAADGSGESSIDSVDDLRGRLRPTALASDPDGNIYVHGTAPNTSSAVVCVASPGTPVTTSGVDCASPVVASALAFDGSGHPLVAAPGAGVRVLEPCAFERSGTITSDPLDSQTSECRWHRVALTGSLPDLTSVEVHTTTAELAPSTDEAAELPDTAWQLAARWTGPADGSWDCLVSSPPGRFLIVRLVVRGSGHVTPRVTRIEVEAPRQTSARHLPAVWRSTPETADFLDRLTAVVDRAWDDLDRTIDDLPALLDPAATPADEGRDFLTWLASWFELANRLAIPEPVLRRLVANAAALYEAKGTPQGLRDLVRILLGLDLDADLPVPGLLEGHQLRRWALLGEDGRGPSRLGDCATLWGARIEDRLQVAGHATIGQVRLLDTPDPWRDPLHHHAHRVTVFVPAARCAGQSSPAAIERAVELFAPAHVVATVEWVRPQFRVGVQATIGVDAALGRYPAGAVVGDVDPVATVSSLPGDEHGPRLGVDAVVGGSGPSAHPAFQVGQFAIGSSPL